MRVRTSSELTPVSVDDLARQPAGGAVEVSAPLADERTRRLRLVYVLAASHSGSTLLSMLLGSHPDLCTVGELKAVIHEDINRYQCSCGELIRQCPFWARINALMRKSGFAFDISEPYTDVKAIRSPYVRRLLRPLHRGAWLEHLRDAALRCSPTWRREYPRVQARTAALIRAVFHLTGANIIVDSSKYALRLKYALRNPALDVQVVRLIRDGRAVALTYRVDDHRPSMRKCAEEWRRSNEEAEELLGRVAPARWTEVRYEELCADPRATMQRLFRFIDVAPGPVNLDFRSRSRHVVGNWMRLQETTEIKRDDRWKTMLSAEDLAEFDAVAGDTNRHYGYE
jgi:hypothetical protein